MEYFSILTSAGLAKLIKASTNSQNIVLTKMAVSDTDTQISQEWEDLPSKKHEFSINTIIQSEEDPNVLICEGAIASEVGGFYIKKVGVYTSDGSLFAVGKVPESYKPLLNEGSTKDVTIRFYLQIDNATNITLKVDNNIVLATRTFVTGELKKLDKKFDDYYTKSQSDERYEKKGEAKTIPAGTVVAFVGSSSNKPDGYLICDGSTISRTTYSALFAAIGTTYGSGDGSATFKIPDFRGCFLRGLGGNASSLGSKQSDAFGSHKHDLPVADHRVASSSGGYSSYTFSDTSLSFVLQQDKVLGDNGWATPTSYHASMGGSETRPVNYAVNWLIKY